MDAELIVMVLSVVVTVVSSTSLLAYWLGRKFAEIDARMRAFEDRFDGIEREMRRIARALSAASVEAHRVVVDYMSIKGVIEKGEAEYLSRRVEGLFHVHVSTVNPLTKEELKFLKEFFAKDPDLVTEEEAERAYEIGKRLFVEDLDPNGYLIAIAAAYRRGYLVSKRVRERKKKEEERKKEGEEQRK